MIVVLDPTGTVIFETPSAGPVLGYPPGALLGTRMADLVHPGDTDVIGMCDPSTGSVPATNLGRLRLADGQWAAVEVTGSDLTADPAVGGLVLTIRDVRERHALEQRLTYQAYHDPLTGLPNRQMFSDQLGQVLTDADSAVSATSLLYLDLDDFKSVNDTMGHDAGDQLLRVVGERLAAALRSQDVLCRFGGDEFAAILPATDPGDAEQAASRLCAALTQPWT